MAIQEFKKYYIPVFWDDEYKKLNYIQEEFNDSESLVKWRLQGYSSKFTGHMCDMSGIQPKWNETFIKIYEEFGWKDIGTSYYRMDTGTVLPNHSDLYVKYIDLFKLHGKENTIRRAIVFLDDWKSGHYAECCKSPIVSWRKGEVIEWEYDVVHMAANIGIEPRYTLQITGHV